jgi:hypothetical protein
MHGMRFLRVFGKLLCFIGALVALMGVLATAVPMIDNERTQSIVASFSTRGDSAVVNGFNSVVQYCLDHNYFVFIAGMVVLLLGGGLKSFAEKALFKSIFTRAPAPPQEEPKPDAPAEAKPERVHAPRVTATVPADTRPAFTAPQMAQTPVAEPTDAWPSYTAPKLEGISAAEPEDIQPSYTPPSADAKPAEIPEPHSLLFPDVKPTAKEMEEIVYGVATWESPAPDAVKPESEIASAVPARDALFAPAVEAQFPDAAAQTAAASPVVYTQRYAPVRTEHEINAAQLEPQSDVDTTADVTPTVTAPAAALQTDAALPWVTPIVNEWNADGADSEPTAAVDAAPMFQPPVQPDAKLADASALSAAPESEPETVREAAMEAVRLVQAREEQPAPMTQPPALSDAVPVTSPVAYEIREARLTPVQRAPAAVPQRVQLPVAQVAQAPVAQPAQTPVTLPVQAPAEAMPMMQPPVMPIAAPAPVTNAAREARPAPAQPVPSAVGQRAQPPVSQPIQAQTAQPIRTPAMQPMPARQQPAASVAVPTAAPAQAAAVPLQRVQMPVMQPAYVPVTQPTFAPVTQPMQTRAAQPAQAPAEQPMQTRAAQPAQAPAVQPAPLRQQPAASVVVPTAAPAQAAAVPPQPVQTPLTQPTYAPVVQPAYVPVTQPTFAPVTQPMQTRAAQPAQAPAVQPAPSRPQPAASVTPPNAVPVAYVRREDRPASGHAAAAMPQQPAQMPVSHPMQTPVAQPAQSPAVQAKQAPVAQFMPVRQQPAAPVAAPNAVPVAYAAREPQQTATQRPAMPAPAVPAYRSAASAQAEWQTKSSANDRVIVATRQPVQTRAAQPTPAVNITYEAPAAITPYAAPAAPTANVPYMATAPTANMAPAPAVWIGTRPAPPIPPHFHTPAMQGSTVNTLRTPPPPSAMQPAAQPAPVQPQPQPAQVRIVSTFRGYAAEGQSISPQNDSPSAGYNQYVPFTPPRVSGQPAAQPRIVSTLGQRGERQP